MHLKEYFFFIEEGGRALLKAAFLFLQAGYPSYFNVGESDILLAKGKTYFCCYF